MKLLEKYSSHIWTSAGEMVTMAMARMIDQNFLSYITGERVCGNVAG